VQRLRSSKTIRIAQTSVWSLRRSANLAAYFKCVETRQSFSEANSAQAAHGAHLQVNFQSTARQRSITKAPVITANHHDDSLSKSKCSSFAAAAAPTDNKITATDCQFT
jgi:hypothetical protein